MDAPDFMSVGAVLRDGLERNLGERALYTALMAAGGERTAIGQMQQSRNNTLYGVKASFAPAFFSAPAKPRHRTQQPLCVWVSRIVEHLHGRSDFHNLSR